MLNAKWIWLAGEEKTPNCYVVFRKTFRLSKKKRLAKLHISAYTHYQAYLNGRRLGWGPNPSHPTRYYYDTYDLADTLKSGKNVLAVLAYSHGPHVVSPETVFSEGTPSGLIFQIDVDGKTFITSDSSCKVRRADGWDAASPGFSELRTAFKEWVDGRKENDRFILPALDDRDWKNAKVLGDTTMSPFTQIVPREIPMMQVEKHQPQNAYSFGSHYAYGFTENRKWEVTNPLSLVRRDVPAGDRRILIGGENGDPRGENVEVSSRDETTITPYAGGSSPSLLLDFGRLCAGRFRFTLSQAPRGVLIRISYGESMTMTEIDRYTCRDGEQTFESFHRRVARYVLLTFENYKSPVRIREAAFDQIYYPVKNRGSFESSDPLLNSIWQVGRNTVHMSMQDHFEDSIWREQKLFAGDLRIQALSSYYTFGDFSYVGKNIRQLADIPRTDGWIALAGPSYCPDSSKILDFPAHYILSVFDYVLYSGDLKTLEHVYPKMTVQIESYQKLEGSLGLLDMGYEKSFANWCFINWSVVHKEGVVAAWNFLFLQALRAMVVMAGWLKKDDDKSTFEKTAQRYQSTLKKHLWNAKRNCYVDCLTHGKQSSSASLETQTLALLAGMGPASKILNILKSIKPETITKCPFFNAFVIEALFKGKKYVQSLDVLRWYWGGMVERGADTFWEVYDPTWPKGMLPSKIWSQCHGWSAGPDYLLGKYIAGIEPLEPGYKSFTLAPSPVNISYLKTVIPTPAGDIRVEWDETRRLMIHYPSSLSAKVNTATLKQFSKTFINGKNCTRSLKKI
jgi:hypothetical protein